MKLINTILLLALFMVGSIDLSAQKELKEGVIKMEITDVITDNQEMAAMMEMMKGTETNVHFKDGTSLTELNMMGGMVKMNNLMAENGDLTMYWDMMGNKMKVDGGNVKKMGKEMKDSGEDAETLISSLDIEYDEKDRKTVAGYDCYKMTAVPKEQVTEGPSMKIEAYVTDAIKVNATVIQGVDIGEFRGFPLEYIVDAGGQFKMVVSTMELLDKVDASVFNINESGYTEMTMDEFQEQMGGMMGGFGGPQR